MNSLQKIPLRGFSFDIRRRSSNASLKNSSKESEGADSGKDGSSLSPERRERWKKIKLFSQGARVTSRSPPYQSSRQEAFDLLPSSQTASPQMSDFLSRESELLGGEFLPTTSLALAGSSVGDIDLDKAASAFPDISLDGSGDIPVSAPALNGEFQETSSFDSFIEPRAHVRDVKVTGDDEIERFEDQFPDIGGNTEKSPVPQAPTFGASPPFAPRPQPSVFATTPILQQPLTDEDEPDVIREWREKQAADIKARDETSQSSRQESISKAERAIDQFYEEYSSKKERNIKENKQQEAEYLSSLSDSLSAGTTWSRICEYIELENSQSKTLARTGAGTTDLSRFKEVLLRLKREGEAAPGAAGY